MAAPLLPSPYFTAAQRQALSRLTVIIPSYERPHYLGRALRYWSGCGARVLVLDGSRSPFLHRDPRRFLRGDNVTYLHRPVRLAERLALAGEMLDTPYAVLAGDDEFHLASGLSAAIAALDADPALVACCGRVARFALGPRFRPMGAPGYPRFAGHDILHATPAERMVAHMADYVPTTVYAVLRSAVWKAAVQPALRDEVPLFASAELQFELTVMEFGKSRVLPVLQWLRSAEIGATQSADVSLATPTKLHQIWGDPDHQALCRRMIDSTAAALSATTGTDSAELAARIEAALNAYAATVRQRAAQAAPAPERRIAAAARPAQPSRAFRASLGEAVADMAKSGVAVDSKAVARIASLVRSHAIWGDGLRKGLQRLRAGKATP